MNEIDSNKIKSILFDLSNKFILPMYKNLKDTDVMKKNNNDLVTSVDLQIEEKLKLYVFFYVFLLQINGSTNFIDFLVPEL